jgi:hypothetical protein
VRDNGCGIDADRLGELLAPGGHRAARNGGRRAGLGLGLASVSRSRVPGRDRAPASHWCCRTRTGARTARRRRRSARSSPRLGAAC